LPTSACRDTVCSETLSHLARIPRGEGPGGDQRAECVGERAEQVAALAAVAVDAPLDVADRTEHAQRHWHRADEQLIAPQQRGQSERLEGVQLAGPRHAQVIHLRQALGHVRHRLVVQHEAHQLQAVHLPGLGGLRHLAELVRLEPGHVLAVLDEAEPGSVDEVKYAVAVEAAQGVLVHLMGVGRQSG
jgi:hypothetical protein